jgi:hypothetical protein
MFFFSLESFESGVLSGYVLLRLLPPHREVEEEHADYDQYGDYDEADAGRSPGPFME